MSYPNDPYRGYIPSPHAFTANAKTSPLATLSLVFALVSIPLILFFVGVAFAFIAMILALCARRQISGNPYHFSGSGVATAGMSIGVGGIILGIGYLVSFLVLKST